MGLIIRSSTIHAAGCYTTSPIRKSERVVEYTGPLIDKDAADLLYADRPITYLFGIGDGTQVIDGHGTAMFINHSCDANCETEETDGRVWIMSIRDIAAGEELCYDYCLYDGDEEDAPCNCGAKKCRGTMFSPEELKRRKRLEKKSASKRPAGKKTAVKKRKPEKKTVKTKKKTATPAKARRTAKPSGTKSPKKLKKRSRAGR
jgi:hypothetical protein